MAITLYDTLEVSRQASPEVIRAAYKVLVRKYHPDTHAGDLKAAERCTAINKAYDTLSDRDKKKEYDALLRESNESYNGAYQAPTYRSYTPPPPPAPPPKPPRPVYVYDPKWEQFLNDRPDWAKSITPPADSWGDTDPPVRQVIGGFTDVRPDLDMWGRWIIMAGQQTSTSYREIETELARTWSYFSADGGSLTQSLVRQTAKEWCNKAQGINKAQVQWGV
jgi:hypothetical protein